jgi:uroporphyrinogen decarboxylase
MNGSQRFLESMRFGTPDRVPCFEEGIRDVVLDVWREQGVMANDDLSQIFSFDQREEIQLNLDPGPDLDRWPTTSSGLDLLRQNLDPHDSSRFPEDWSERVRRWKEREHVLFLRVNRGFFQSIGIQDWRSFAEVIYLLQDDPAFVRGVMEIQGKFLSGIIDRVLQEVQIDGAVFSEPIGGNQGPLISPGMYAEFVLPCYQPIIEVLERYGVETIIVRTYANARALLPVFVDMGINCLWAHERKTEAMDYLDIRQEFGRELRLIGGIDLDVLRQDPESIRREMEKVVPPLLADEGYIPLVDGRVREDILFENYAYYRRLLEEMTQY